MKMIAGEVVRDKFSISELKGHMKAIDTKKEWKVKEAERARLEKAVKSEQTYLELQHTDMSTFLKLINMLVRSERRERDYCRLLAKRFGYGWWWGESKIEELAYDYAFWKFYHQTAWLAQHTERRVFEAFVFWAIKKMRQ